MSNQIPFENISDAGPIARLLKQKYISMLDMESYLVRQRDHLPGPRSAIFSSCISITSESFEM